ncbi:hypothetical protein [Bradyrhizobium sp. LHD-71]|uniref:hypothetical protein n=1 Tax=Bradyrhizobium sp. LHD-71 TaxID=3072141 RepID=UPI00280EFE68|nr:hypothetical protein [Bradyrhizobium sp. LHD-71]MDQ8728695.1 hypothetical protein [Bradyrhizobium sp. LHD-71]
MTSSNSTSARKSLSRIFAVPAVLGVLTTIGLVSALVGDGIFDGLSWLTLAAPVAIPVYCIARA